MNPPPPMPQRKSRHKNTAWDTGPVSHAVFLHSGALNCYHCIHGILLHSKFRPHHSEKAGAAHEDKQMENFVAAKARVIFQRPF